MAQTKCWQARRPRQSNSVSRFQREFDNDNDVLGALAFALRAPEPWLQIGRALPSFHELRDQFAALMKAPGDED